MKFNPGTKFKYIGSNYLKEYNRTQVVLHILKIGDVESVRSQFIDDGSIHIFDILENKTSYSSYCYPLNSQYDNGIPFFWDEI